MNATHLFRNISQHGIVGKLPNLELESPSSSDQVQVFIGYLLCAKNLLCGGHWECKNKNETIPALNELNILWAEKTFVTLDTSLIFIGLQLCL